MTHEEIELVKPVLKQNYESACNAYLQVFCEKYEFDYEPDMWATPQVGEVACLADYCFGMQDIIFCVQNDIIRGMLFDWYNYCMEAHALGFNGVNLQSWAKGCPRKSEEEIEAIRAKRNYISELEEELKKMCEEDCNKTK